MTVKNIIQTISPGTYFTYATILLACPRGRRGGGGGGGNESFFAGYVLLASLLGECNFSDPNLVTICLCINLT